MLYIALHLFNQRNKFVPRGMDYLDAYNTKLGFIMVVPALKPHTSVSRGATSMSTLNKNDYAATYEYGKTKVHVVAPEPKSQEDIQKILKEYHNAGWTIWNSLSDEEKHYINAQLRK